MSEMLGNQYFMARKYEKALNQFEKVIESGVFDEKIRKKLIICYCEVGNVNAALKLFEAVIRADIEIIARTDVVSEDCPCPELLDRMKWYEKVAVSSFDYNCILGVLSLYCDVSESLRFFSNAQALRPDDSRVNRLLEAIGAYHRNHATP